MHTGIAKRLLGTVQKDEGTALMAEVIASFCGSSSNEVDQERKYETTNSLARRKNWLADACH